MNWNRDIKDGNSYKEQLYVSADFDLTVAASAAGYTDGTDTIDIDDNGPQVTLTVPGSAAENSGVLTGQGSVSVGSAVGSDLSVSLSSDDTSTVTVSASVTISSGNNTETFDVTIVDDDIQDGHTTVTITASAAGYNNGTDPIYVTDNETTVIESGDDSSGCMAGTRGGAGQGCIFMLLNYCVSYSGVYWRRS